jgi:hypothetical protein
MAYRAARQAFIRGASGSKSKRSRLLFVQGPANGASPGLLFSRFLVEDFISWKKLD